ncbi:MAG: hypothetical protein ACRDJ2_14375 [Actinomycetota bacterium]
MNRHEPDEAPGPRDSMTFEDAARLLRVDTTSVQQAALLGELPTTSHHGELRVDRVALQLLLNPYLPAERQGAEA